MQVSGQSLPWYAQGLGIDPSQNSGDIFLRQYPYVLERKTAIHLSMSPKCSVMGM